MTQLTNDDKNLFKQAVESVTPLKQAARAQLRLPAAPNNTIEKRHAATSINDMSEALSDHIDRPITPEESLLFSRPGLQHQQFKKLKQGLIPWEAALDLHGFKIEDARRKLSHFIRHCGAHDLRCVRIIHGKGHHSGDENRNIKTLTHHWLQQLQSVMAFCSCLPKDGGAGAVYVLLKRNNDTSNTDNKV